MKKGKLLRYVIKVKYTLNKLKMYACKMKSKKYDDRLVKEYNFNILKKKIFSLFYKNYSIKHLKRIKNIEYNLLK